MWSGSLFYIINDNKVFIEKRVENCYSVYFQTT